MWKVECFDKIQTRICQRWKEMLGSDVKTSGGKVVATENVTDLDEKLGLYVKEILKKAITERSAAKIALSGELHTVCNSHIL